jgi:hypothetical protein
MNITHQLHLTLSKKDKMYIKTVALTWSWKEIVFPVCNYACWETLAS